MFWTTVSGANHATACGQWWGSPVGTVADWARNASRMRGTELVEGPVAVTVGGCDTVRIWLVEAGDTVLYVESDTHGSAGPHLEREVDAIVASMAFD